MNTGGIIILVAVLLFCIYEVVHLALDIARKKKKKKEGASTQGELILDDKINEGGASNERNADNAVDN